MFVLRWTIVSLKDLNMDPRSLSLAVISVGFVCFVNFALPNPIIDSSESSSEIAKAFLDCKHSDYRTYIQCLKRQKRQYPELQDIDTCIASCMYKCSKENRVCNETCAHCMHKSKRKFHIINITETEYETEVDCTKSNCTAVDKNGKQREPVVVNVTNHIHIHNHYNNSDRTHHSQNPCPCYHIIWFPCYCRPQYSICQYPQQWPCTPYGGGFSGGFNQGGYGVIGTAPGLSVANNCCATCTCTNQDTICDECNPPAG